MATHHASLLPLPPRSSFMLIMIEITGSIPFQVGNETFSTWYRVVGNFNSGARPLVILHGGPGIPNPYMYPLEELYSSHNIPVIFYDQIGVGNSSHLRDKPSSFWTVDLFMDELDNLIHHLGISKTFSLLGHSWGGMLGSNYAATRRPACLKALVLSSTPASVDLWMQCMNELLNRFTKDVGQAVKRYERDGLLESEEYETAMTMFNKKHLCKLNPWPQQLLDSLTLMGEDMTVTDHM